MVDRPPLPHPEEFHCVCPIEVRFRDLDAMGHVNNAVYLTYLENARCCWVSALDLPDVRSAELTARFPFILAEIRVQYLRAAKLGERLEVRVRATSVGRKSFELEYLLVDEPSRTPYLHAFSTQIYFDYAEQRSAVVPDDWRAAIERLESHA